MTDYLTVRMLVGCVDEEAGLFGSAIVDAPFNVIRERVGIATFSESHLREDIAEDQLAHRLFEALFPPLSGNREVMAMVAARALPDPASRRPGQPVRLRLQLDSRLADLPWECMRYLGTDRRALEIEQARRLVVRFTGPTTSPQRSYDAKRAVMLILSDPAGTSAPDLSDALREEIDELVSFFNSIDIVTYKIYGKDTIRKITEQVEMINHSGESLCGVHIVGHGASNARGNFVIFHDEYNCAVEIPPAILVNIFSSEHTIEWMFLSLCEGAADRAGYGSLAASLSSGLCIPYVLAYARPVGATQAHGLALEFYQNFLRSNMPVPDAVLQMRRRRRAANELVLFERAVEEAPDTSRPRVSQPVGAAAPALGSQPTATARGASGSLPAGTPTAPGSAVPASVEVDLEELIEIPAGPFQRGLTPEQIDKLLADFRKAGLALDLDQARRTLEKCGPETVDLPRYRICKYPVTNLVFQQFVDATGHLTTAERQGSSETWRKYAGPGKELHPVVCVSYYDAQAFAQWKGLRLPTAEEWEKACRGPNGNLYPWGDDFDPERCNHSRAFLGEQTIPVNRLPAGASPYGVMDMVGNAEELTASLDDRGLVIVKGGSWAMTCQVYGLAVLNRLARKDFFGPDTGFRCAAD